MINKEHLKKMVQWPVISRIYHHYIYFQNWRNRKFTYTKKPMQMIYKMEDLNREYYEKMKKTADRKLEHQIGRLINYKDIIKNCADLTGDVIEFGCWQGFSLLWIAYFMERNAILDKKLIGLDGFIGIPYAEGIFHKGLFRDTSLEKCKKNVLENRLLYIETRKNIFIAQYLFKKKKEIIKYLRINNVGKLCFIHIDCDVSESVKEIFEILFEGDFIANKAYILFDDWGCDCNIPEVANEIFDRMKKNWRILEHSHSNLTKNFYLERKNE